MTRRGRLFLSLAVCSLAGLVPGPAGATDTRVETLGASGLYLEDDDNIWTYPSSLRHYPDLLIVGLGGQVSKLSPASEMRSTGTLELPRGMVLGVSFGSEERKVTYAPLSAREQVHLFFGAPVKAGGYGLRLSRYGAIDNRPPTFERSVSVTEIDVGVEAEIGGGKAVEATLTGSIANFRDIVAGAKRSEPRDYYDIGLRLRGRIDPGEKIRVITVMTGDVGSQGVLVFSSGQESTLRKDSYQAARIGAAVQFQPQADILVVSHVSLAYRRSSSVSPATGSGGSSADVWDLPLAGIGVEKWVAPWLALRMGAVFRIRLDDEEDSTGGSSRRQTSVSTVQTLGMALRLAGFHADFAIEPAVLEVGPHLISGMTVPLTSKLTLRFGF